jgi:hyperosmotically inducible periplasmic protein
MKTKFSLKFIAPAVLLGLAMAMPAFAQETAGEAMHSAGDNLKQAGSDTAAAAEDAYHGTKIEVKDTTISAKVKRAMHDDQMVSGSEIHVSTNAGVVTLKGQVSSREAAAHAGDVAARIEGVKRVDNQLMVSSAARTD